MIAPAYAVNVRQWLGGLEPVWTVLDAESVNALQHEPSATNPATRLETDLPEADLSGSAVVRTARTLLQQAIDNNGLGLTATGNLSRKTVAEMIELIDWPSFDKALLFDLSKIINEPDVLPLHFVRKLLQQTKLLQTRREKLVPSRLGRDLLSGDQIGSLQALLFHVSLWHVNFGYFDRNPIENWPQTHAGIVLWSLSVAANDWADRESLTRLCTIPVPRVLNLTPDFASYAMESRILKPLLWFGLLEFQTSADARGARLYRKSALFDRFLHFEIHVERTATRH